jgi:hypothetical protein
MEVDHMSASAPERFLQRIRAEYLEMPGLRLTRGQVERLCGVEHTISQVVLDALVEAKFLCVKGDGAYGRLTDGDLVRPRPAKAVLRPLARAASA